MSELTWKLALAIFASSVGSSFQYGYNAGVINSPQNCISQFINETYFDRTGDYMEASRIALIWSMAVSIFRYSAIIGAMFTALVADRLGRKSGLLWNNVLFISAALLEGGSKAFKSYEMLIGGRFLIGFSSGLGIGLVILYLTEIAPVSLRGAVGTVHPLMVFTSILLSQILGLDVFLGTESRWIWLFLFTTLFSIIQLRILPLCPESPRYTFFQKGNEAEARAALVWFRETDQVQEELLEMQAEGQQANCASKAFFHSSFRTPLLISCVLMLAQQLCGVNAVVFFSTKIFISAGLNETSARVATFGMDFSTIVLTAFSILLVEKVGRKGLMLFTMFTMTCNLILLTFCSSYSDSIWASYACIILVLIFLSLFGVGLGSIPWYFFAELFPQRTRAVAASIIIPFNMTASLLVHLGFLPLLIAMDSNAFIMFAGLLVAFLVFTFFVVPETQGKSLREICALYDTRSSV